MVYFNNNNTAHKSHTNNSGYKPKYSGGGHHGQKHSSPSSATHSVVAKYPILAAILILACITAGCPALGLSETCRPSDPNFAESFFGSIIGSLPTFFSFRSVHQRLSGAGSFAANAVASTAVLQFGKKKDDDEEEDAAVELQTIRAQMMATQQSPDHYAVTFMYQQPGKNGIEVPLVQLAVACSDSTNVCRRVAPFSLEPTTAASATSEPETPSLPASSSLTPAPFHNDNDTEAGVTTRRVSIIVSYKGNLIRMNSYLLVPTGGMCEGDEGATEKCSSLFTVRVGELEAIREILTQDPAIATKIAHSFKVLNNEKGAGEFSEARASSLAADLDFFIGRVCAPAPLLSITKGETSFKFDTPFTATATHKDGSTSRLNFIATECMPTSSNKVFTLQRGSAPAHLINRSAAVAAASAIPEATLITTPLFCNDLPEEILNRQAEYDGIDVPVTSARKFVGMVPKRNMETNLLMLFNHLMPSLSILRVQAQTIPDKARDISRPNTTPPTSKGSCNLYFQTADQANDALRLHKRVYFDVRTSAKGTAWLGFWAFEDTSLYGPETPTDAIEVQKQIMRDFSFLRGDDPTRRLYSDFVCKGETNIEDAKNVERSRNGMLSDPYQRYTTYTNNPETAARNAENVAISAASPPPQINNYQQNTYSYQAQYSYNGNAQPFTASTQAYPYQQHFETQQYNTQQMQQNLAAPYVQQLPSRTYTVAAAPVPPRFSCPFSGSTKSEFVDTMNGEARFRHNPYGDLLATSSAKASSATDSPMLSVASAGPPSPLSVARGKAELTIPSDETHTITPSLTDDEDQVHHTSSTTTPLENDVEVASVNATDGDYSTTYHPSGIAFSRQHSSMFAFATRQVSTAAVNGDGFHPTFMASF